MKQYNLIKTRIPKGSRATQSAGVSISVNGTIVGGAQPVQGITEHDALHGLRNTSQYREEDKYVHLTGEAYNAIKEAMESLKGLSNEIETDKIIVGVEAIINGIIRGENWQISQDGIAKFVSAVIQAITADKWSISQDGIATLVKAIAKTMKSDRYEVGNYLAGILGAGGIFEMANGNSRMEVDEIFVRKVAHFVEIVIERLSHVGGNLVLSHARMKCSKVEDLPNAYRCYFERGDGEAVNTFSVGSQARCQVFNGKGQKYYWRLVTNVGDDYIDLSKTDKEGESIPEVGDHIVALGHRTDKARQSAILLSAYGSGAPSITQYEGINSYSLDGKEVTRLSPKGNKLVGEVRLQNGTKVEEYVVGQVSATKTELQNSISQLETKVGNDRESAINQVMAVMAEKTAQLQKQVDGEISNWFYEGAPASNKLPESEWTTNQIKARHIGDTYTSIDKYPNPNAGKSWRYTTSFTWELIADSDVTKALKMASEAQSTADGKSTTYLAKPTAYSIGDTWVLAEAWNGYKKGSILVAKKTSKSFSADDWEESVRYTDDTLVKEVQTKLQEAEKTLEETKKKAIANDGRITQAEQKAIDEATKAYNKAKADLDAMQIGTRNLALGTATTIKLEPQNSGEARDNYNYAKFYLTDKNATELSLTASITNIIGNVGKIYVLVRNKKNASIADKTFPIIDGKISGNIKISAGQSTSGGHILIYAGVGGATRGNGITISELMVVEGNKSSDWSEAPEDRDARLLSVRNLALGTAKPITSDKYLLAEFPLSQSHQFVNGEVYTLSFDCKLGPDRKGVHIYNSGTSVSLIRNVTRTADGKYVIKFRWRNTEGAYTADNSTIRVYQYNEGTYVSTISNVMLVKGDKEYPWQEAPEDAEKRVQTYTDTQFTLLDDRIKQRVAQVDFDRNNQAVAQRMSQIEQTANGISTRVESNTRAIGGKADQSSLNSLTQKVTTIEQTANGIKTEVSKKAGKDTIVSEINQSAEGIKIKASKLDFDGEAVFQLLKGMGLTKITGGVISLSDVANIITAGISGLRGSDSSLPVFWAGGNYDQAKQGNVNALIKHNGYARFGKGERSFVVDENGNTKIGAWNVDTNGYLKQENTQYTTSLSPTEVIFREKGGSNLAVYMSVQGVFSNRPNMPFMPGSAGVDWRGAVVGLAQTDEEDKSFLGAPDRIRAGVVGLPQNTNTINPCPTYGGYFNSLYVGGFIGRTKVLGTNSTSFANGTAYEISPYDTLILAIGGNGMFLPEARKVPEGWTIRVMAIGGGVLTRAREDMYIPSTIRPAHQNTETANSVRTFVRVDLRVGSTTCKWVCTNVG